MPERGSRLFETPPGGSSPVPEEYGSLGGPPPARADDEGRERRPFRWRQAREEEPEGAPGPEADEDGAGSHAPVAYARTSSEPGGPPTPATPPPKRSATPVGEGRPAAPARPGPKRRPAAPPVTARRPADTPAAQTAAQAEPETPAQARAAAAAAGRRPDGRARAAAARSAIRPGTTTAGASPAGAAGGGPAPAGARPRAAGARGPAARSDRAPAAAQAAATAAVPAVRNRAPEDRADDETGGRRFRVVPPSVPRERVDERGRVRRQKDSEPAMPEARPAAYMKETIRTRQVIRHFDLLSVLRVSLLFYFLGVVSLVLAGIVLWNVATALGTINSIDKSIKTLFDLKSFTLHPTPVLGYGLAAGVVLMIVGTLLNVLVATIFNLISDVTGGIVVRVVNQPDDR